MDILLNFNSQERFLLSYLIIINITSFVLFAIDKGKAKRKAWRISEKVLLIVSIIGGATGSLMAMVIFKHKLSKKRFYKGVPVFIVLGWVVGIWVFGLVK